MTALRRLQDAITKLEQLRDQTRYEEYADHLIEVVTMGTELNPWQEPSPLTHDELLITLHRTLDAQLSILAYGATLVGPIPECILALADAILGTVNSDHLD